MQPCQNQARPCFTHFTRCCVPMRDLLLFAHFFGLVIGAGSGFALFVIGRLSPRFPAEARRSIVMTLFPLRQISYAGLALLIVSGGVLSQPFYPLLGNMPWFQVKLTAVAALTGLSVAGMILMHKLRNGGPDHHLRQLGLIGKISVVLSLIVLACAVASFH